MPELNRPKNKRRTFYNARYRRTCTFDPSQPSTSASYVPPPIIPSEPKPEDPQDFLTMFEEWDSESDWDDSEESDIVIPNKVTSMPQLYQRHKDTCFWPRYNSGIDYKMSEIMRLMLGNAESPDLLEEYSSFESMCDIEPIDLTYRYAENRILYPVLAQYNPEQHKKLIEHATKLHDCVHKAYTKPVGRQSLNIVLHIGKHIKALEGIGWAIYQLFRQGAIPIDNDVCTLCLREKCRRPVVCYQCLKVIACAKCMRQLLKGHQKTLLVQCLKCRRRSITVRPFFHYC